MAVRKLVVAFSNGDTREYTNVVHPSVRNDPGPGWDGILDEYYTQDAHVFDYQIDESGNLNIERKHMTCEIPKHGSQVQWKVKATEKTAFIPAGSWSLVEWQDA